MARGFPSMTALLGLLAVAGFQNRDKISEMLRGAGQQGGMGGGSGQVSGSGGSYGGHDAPGGMADPTGQVGRQGGGLGGILGGLTGGAGGAGGSFGSGAMGGGLGGLLGSLGGMGAGGLLSGGLGELVDRFRQSGQGEAVDSWVRPGPNQPIEPTQLERSIGADTLEELSQQTGLPREELLARLSRELPDAVDKYTPDGKLPDLDGDGIPDDPQARPAPNRV
jgi:uncharacterized protein YidB (DUF937 family)